MHSIWCEWNKKREYANNNTMILDRRIWNRWEVGEIFENSMGLLSLGFDGMMMRFCAQQMWRANLVWCCPEWLAPLIIEIRMPWETQGVDRLSNKREFLTHSYASVKKHWYRVVGMCKETLKHIDNSCTREGKCWWTLIPCRRFVQERSKTCPAMKIFPSLHLL